MNKDKKHLFNLTKQELSDIFKDAGFESFRLTQVMDWVYQKNETDVSKMINLPASLKHWLSVNVDFVLPKVVSHEAKDGTIKFQYLLNENQTIESVWIPEENRNTLCVSSQVGCALKCAFCVTGTLGLKRNLTVDEIVWQVYHVKNVLKKPISNLVFMGMGEPLQNEAHLIKAIDILTDDQMFGFGRRKITVSTAGWIPKIKSFFESTKVKMALSLTGFDDEKRNAWMPVNRKYNLNELFSVLKNLQTPKGQKITFEVVLIKEQTDSNEDAQKLIDLINPIKDKAKVNLIPYNENPWFPNLKRPSETTILSFQNALKARGILTFIRKNRGNDVYSACGQLSGQTTGLKNN